jgi:hypothetical protein
MMNGKTQQQPSNRMGLVSLFLLTFLASSGFFQRNLGLGGLLAYAALLASAGYAWWKFRESIQGWINHRFWIWLVVLAVGLLAVFAVGYPIEDAQGPGRSSDRDDGLNIAVERLLAGDYPYYPPHPEAGPLSLFPGAILLSVPFVILGNSAYQNFFWIAVFLGMTVRCYGRRGELLLLLAVLFGLSPAVQYEFISGGDMLANGIYVAVALGLFIRHWASPGDAWRQRLATALFLGLALSSRPNFLLLMPLVGGAVWRWGGFPRAIVGCSLAVAAAAAVTLPFFLADPSGFTPLIAGNKLALIDGHLPGGGRALQGLSALAAIAAGLWLILKRGHVDESTFFALAAWVTSVPMIGAVVLYSFIKGYADFSFMHPRYGLMYLFMALWAWGLTQPFQIRSDNPYPGRP